MSIKVAPFVGIAKPQTPGPLAKAYWQSNVSVEEIKVRFGAGGGKAAGPAALHGIVCKGLFGITCGFVHSMCYPDFGLTCGLEMYDDEQYSSLPDLWC